MASLKMGKVLVFANLEDCQKKKIKNKS
jgi:hypothetical protein